MVTDKRYISWGNYFRKGQMFGMDFIFDEIPNKLVPFDFAAFANSSEELVAATTDVVTGETVFYRKSDPDFDVLTVLRASSSLPFIAPIVNFKGRQLLDGGISDPIPLKQAEKDGFARNVVVLTRDAGYRKSPNRFAWFGGCTPNFRHSSRSCCAVIKSTTVKSIISANKSSGKRLRHTAPASARGRTDGEELREARRAVPAGLRGCQTRAAFRRRRGLNRKRRAAGLIGSA